MVALRWAPKVLLHVSTGDLSLVVDEIRDIFQIVAWLAVEMILAVRKGVPFFLSNLHNCARDYAYIALFGQGLILLQIAFPVLTHVYKLLILWQPIREVVLGEDGKVALLNGCGPDEVGRFIKILVRLHRLGVELYDGYLVLRWCGHVEIWQ